MYFRSRARQDGVRLQTTIIAEPKNVVMICSVRHIHYLFWSLEEIFYFPVEAVLGRQSPHRPLFPLQSVNHYRPLLIQQSSLATMLRKALLLLAKLLLMATYSPMHWKNATQGTQKREREIHLPTTLLSDDPFLEAPRPSIWLCNLSRRGFRVLVIRAEKFQKDFWRLRAEPRGLSGSRRFQILKEVFW